ncbi:hypothetical protein [Mesorhizobium erdmanii]|uniref:hypothetical protein n=1 Tax=Mesorhizobium erdmanii TaxID=1777866 RepID=UPI0012B62A7A|nr:hypothetical protein [Mesorhizobium erdmanii]
MTLKMEIRALAVSVILVLPFTSLVGAATMSFGDAVGLWAQACGAEVPNVCKGIRPGSGQLVPCISAKASPACQAATTAFLANMNARLTAQAAAPKLCASDVKRYCSTQKKGQAKILRCLTTGENFRRLMNSCKQAMTDAGWLDVVSKKSN